MYYTVMGLTSTVLMLIVSGCNGSDIVNRYYGNVTYQWADANSMHYNEVVLDDAAAKKIIKRINDAPSKIIKDKSIGISTRHYLKVGDSSFVVNYPKCDSIRLNTETSIKVWKIDILPEILSQVRAVSGRGKGDKYIKMKQARQRNPTGESMVAATRQLGGLHGYSRSDNHDIILTY